MERYHDFQIKDHYFWTDAAPEYITKEERQAAKPKPELTKPAKVEKPLYRDWEEIEAVGSGTYYSAQVSNKPVIFDGYMV
jgi:hypothetical protein